MRAATAAGNATNKHRTSLPPKAPPTAKTILLIKCVESYKYLLSVSHCELTRKQSSFRIVLLKEKPGWIKEGERRNEREGSRAGRSEGGREEGGRRNEREGRGQEGEGG